MEARKISLQDIDKNKLVLWVDNNVFDKLRNYLEKNMFLRVQKASASGSFIVFKSPDEDTVDRIEEYDFYYIHNFFDDGAPVPKVTQLINEMLNKSLWRFAVLRTKDFENSSSKGEGILFDINTASDEICSPRICEIDLMC